MVGKAATTGPAHCKFWMWFPKNGSKNIQGPSGHRNNLFPICPLCHTLLRCQTYTIPDSKLCEVETIISLFLWWNTRNWSQVKAGPCKQEAGKQDSNLGLGWQSSGYDYHAPLPLCCIWWRKGEELTPLLLPKLSPRPRSHSELIFKSKLIQWVLTFALVMSIRCHERWISQCWTSAPGADRARYLRASLTYTSHNWSIYNLISCVFLLKDILVNRFLLIHNIEFRAKALYTTFSP